MKTVNILVLNCGTYPSPASLVEVMKEIPMREVRELGWDGEMIERRVPDDRTDLGQRYYSYLKEQERAELEAYAAGKEFSPGEFLNA